MSNETPVKGVEVPLISFNVYCTFCHLMKTFEIPHTRFDFYSRATVHCPDCSRETWIVELRHRVQIIKQETDLKGIG